MNDLKSCPFCGGESVREFDGGDPIIHFHHDGDCFLSGEETMYDCPSAEKAWNRRAERTCRILSYIDKSPASYGWLVHRCSSCGKALPKALFRNGWTALDYCPRCGAKVVEE